MQSSPKTAQPMPHTLTIDSRERAVVTGVSDVDCFNEQLVVLLTSMGQMTVVGSGLSVGALDLEQGRLVLTGEIQAVEYAGRAKKGGLLGKILR